MKHVVVRFGADLECYEMVLRGTFLLFVGVRWLEG